LTYISHCSIINEISRIDDWEKVTFNRTTEGAEKVDAQCVCMCSEGGGDDEAVKEKRRLYGSVAVVHDNRDTLRTSGGPRRQGFAGWFISNGHHV
jgi:hypothetical protein